MKQAVEDAGTFDDNEVREFLVGQKFNAPQGLVEVMPNHHLSQTVKLVPCRGWLQSLKRWELFFLKHGTKNIQVQKDLHAIGQILQKAKSINFKLN